MSLDLGDFPAYFRAVYDGRDPFPWQEDLLERVAQRRRWPDHVTLPTGTGKTTLIDLAVFLLALQAGRPRDEQWTPRRLAFVVDRRVVVDQAAGHSRRLALLLDSSGTGVLREVADTLRALSGADGSPPLLQATLRGGMLRDDSWADRPDVPTVLCSTVDQVGSRLLFRGYGVSDGMRPVHAGLLAHDVLYLLDEVHLSRPFAQTLRQLSAYQSWGDDEAAVAALPDRRHVVELTATPQAGAAGWQYPEGPLDPESSEVLRRRLTASKPASLQHIRVRRSDPAASSVTFSTACTEALHAALQAPHVRVAGVIVNRVDTARAVKAGLDDHPPEDTDIVLLTGRMRPLDRDRVLADHLDRLHTGRPRPGARRRLVLVATQCIEAGADFDLDALVTECASLDALRQRFGRVDRDGHLSGQGTPAPGTVLVRSTDLDEKTADPVYGDALRATWTWLQDLPAVDFGLGVLPVAEAPPDTAAPVRDAPLLFPAHLDAWVQTSPVPRPDPEVSRWLHGPQDTVAEVQVVWRADLTAELLLSVDGGAAALHRLEMCPPSSLEAVGLPLAAVRRWLDLNDPEAEPVRVADVEGVTAESTPASGPSRPFVRWHRTEEALARSSADLQPGDVVVVPAAYGGLRDDSWDPTSTEPVRDLALQAQIRQRRRAVVRLVKGLDGLLECPGPADLPEAGATSRDVVVEFLHGLLDDPGSEVPGSLLQAVGHLAEVGKRQVVVRELPGPGAAETSYVVTSPVLLPPERATPVPLEPEPETSAFTGASAVWLDEHLDQVGRWVERFASNCGLPRRLVDDLRLAARLHDLGKADPRFQTWLHGGDEVEAALSERLLAKSVIAGEDRQAREQARTRSQYPKGARHELLSLHLLESEDSVRALAHDWDLVRHLVASHHGWCRPFAPPVPHPEPRHVAVRWEGSATMSARSDHPYSRLDSGVPDRFWSLVRRYGWFRLAYLEALLRLADHRRSAEERDLESVVRTARD